MGFSTETKRTPRTTNIHVPSKYYLFGFVTQIIALSFISKFINCEQQQQQHYQRYLRPTTSTQYLDYYFDTADESSSGPIFGGKSFPADSDAFLFSGTDKPTPPLDSVAFVASRSTNSDQYDQSTGNNIAPERVLSATHLTYGPENNLFSPIFNLQLIDPNLAPLTYPQQSIREQAQFAPPQNFLDTTNGFNDLIEPGSGAGGWDSHPVDDTSNIMEDSTIMPSLVTTPSFNIQATPTMNGEKYNQAPMLNRRLPKLVVTSGQVWRYFLPFDTFVDEDGDLRQLKSSIFQKKPRQHSTVAGANKPDMNFDTTTNRESIENDAGRHELVLVVSDRLGATSEEVIEITVRQHQSTRAFTHLFAINKIYWNWQKYPSFIDALGEFVKRISTNLYLDQPFKNFIVQYYNIDTNQKITNNSEDQSRNIDFTLVDQANMNMSFNIAWSNSSIPIHPCNLSQLENLSRTLVDTQPFISGWSLEGLDKLEVAPSQDLILALGPEFKPTSVSIHLQGACEGKESTASNSVQELDNSDPAPRVRIKIGKLTWKLGEPIEYRIPSETFGAERGSLSSRDLQLTLHTIDGLVLEKDSRYSFLEFDQESQTLFGLSYSQTDHAGQKEMLLTARHPKSGKKAREVFVINIEPQDLTTINNRAFRMSLYMATRTGIFGPRERVALSHKVAAALRVGDPDFHHDRDNPELIVMNIQKFEMSPYSKDGLSSGGYQDKITRVPDIVDNQENHLYARETAAAQDKFFYKYTWTNGTIGYRGDCPVEVIKENILYSLERSMLEYRFFDAPVLDDPSKNDSTRFYDRLRLYFEPDSDLIHLRFEPLGACISALELHDVGNNDLADYADRASESPLEPVQETATFNTPLTTTRPDIEQPNSDEYWSIVVLIILVIALIFVIIMFFLGMHTYKINQDKRFELQVKLAQARQNSMYLSSMILANQATADDICRPMVAAPGVTKSMYVVQDNEKGSRKPVILDNEKQLLTSNQHGLKATTVQLSGQTIQTTPLNPNMTFTLDSIASCNWQPAIATLNPSPSSMMQPFVDDKQRSTTLHRRPSNSTLQLLRSNQQTSMGNLNHSHSILTVASMARPMPIMSQGPLPIVYGPVHYVNEHPKEFIPHNYSSLPRGFGQYSVPGPPLMANGLPQTSYPTHTTDYVVDPSTLAPIAKAYLPQQQMLTPNDVANSNLAYNKARSPSYSSSTSATTQSVISNPNYAPTK